MPGAATLSAAMYLNGSEVLASFATHYCVMTPTFQHNLIPDPKVVWMGTQKWNVSVKLFTSELLRCPCWSLLIGVYIHHLWTVATCGGSHVWDFPDRISVVLHIISQCFSAALVHMLSCVFSFCVYITHHVYAETKVQWRIRSQSILL